VPRKPKNTSTNGFNGANFGFGQKPWAASDKMNSHIAAAEYRHVALGIIFLKYISDTFEERRPCRSGTTTPPIWRIQGRTYEGR
jgi:hypothetical protein